ncbi:MAG: hypothetical protein J7L89_06360 [Bacteroidales bacterium]|nr:hypothetical protein [Bacteroidales bacterium]
MKKLLFLTAMVAVLLSSCTPENPGPDPATPQDVIFTSTFDGGGFKSDDPFSCSNPPADYAMLVIEQGGVTTTYYPAVFYLNGVLYTQAVKLAPGDYQLTEFVLMHAEGDPNDRTDDIVVNAAPHAGSTYGDMLVNPLPVFFTVEKFVKKEIPVEILCYEESSYADFGFVWFKITETTLHEKWFFGDFCTKNYMDYAGSDYETNGLQVDMPAIFKIEVYRNGDLRGTYSNLGQAPGPLAVNYIDRPGVTDNFELKVYILVKIGNQFDYKYFGSWFFVDDGDIFTQNGSGPGDDGVYDFVLGNCNAGAADFTFAPYMNLPETATLTVSTPAAPRDAYLDALVAFTGTGYDMTSGTMDAFCFDRDHTISLNTPYQVDVYSSLYTNLMPDDMGTWEWDRLNWLINHLGNFTGYTWIDLQNALWKLRDNTWNGNSSMPWTQIATDMYNAAVTNGDGFVPLPGNYAAVSFAHLNGQGELDIQVVFVIVDP